MALQPHNKVQLGNNQIPYFSAAAICTGLFLIKAHARSILTIENIHFYNITGKNSGKPSGKRLLMPKKHTVSPYTLYLHSS